MKVLFFAHLRHLTGSSEWQLNSPQPVSVDEFWKILLGQFPQLSAQKNQVRLACNQQYLREGGVLNPDDEVALIPPVSGG